MRLLLTTTLAFALLVSASGGAQIRAPADGGITGSLGQPTLWKWTTGPATGWMLNKGLGPDVVEARLGAYRDLLNPLFGIAAMHVEGQIGARDGQLNGGLRVRFVSPTFRIGIGADYSTLDDRTRLLLSAYHPGRRGGLFRDGSLIRLDFAPGHNQWLTVGIETPIYRRIPTGKTRPAQDHVSLPTAKVKRLPEPDPGLGLAQAIVGVREAAAWIRRTNVPFLAQKASGPASEAGVAAELRELKRGFTGGGPGGTGESRTVESEVRRYHAELERAFSIAIAGHSLPAGSSTPEGRAAAAQARSVLLAEVLFPYNRLLGQMKKPDGIGELGNRARGVFLRWLYTSSDASRDATDAVVWVFSSLIEIVEENRAAAHARWRDSRFVWLPLQYGLLPEEHDTQAKLDALIEQAVGAPFTEGNFASYVINEQYQWQLSRTITQAEDYHVLWTHDVRGYAIKDNPDEMSYHQVLSSYLKAMTERVRGYDRTGKFPVYIILLDQVFYEARRGRLWMNLLEDPTRFRLQLPPAFKSWEDSIGAAQDSLRAAIAASRLLQAQKKQYGERWLRELIKVHVNITNPADPSFWSWDVVRFLPLPDNMMRDHQKMAFYDLTELDPYRGEALFTGAGIGEAYANKSWEDRSLLVRGPAVLELKYAAVRLLRNQGMAADKIPYPLQPRAKAPDYDARIRVAEGSNQRPLRAITIHNGTGFDLKQINVAKGVLYTLMPAGSVIKIPDSIWNNEFWGAALFGSALRGVRVLVIAPSNANNPVTAFGSRQLSREMLWRLLTAQQTFASEIAAAGGLLKIGVYAPEFPVTDIPSKVRSVEITFARHAWLRELFDIAPSVYVELSKLAAEIAHLSMADDRETVAAPDFAFDPRPKLHIKANFFASREAWRLMSRPEWGQLTRAFVYQRIAQVQTRSVAVRSFEAYPDAMIDLGEDMVPAWTASLDPASRERVIFYTVMGSHNQNYRSMVTDGEDAFVVANWPSVIPYLDLISLVGQSRWVETTAELDALVPPQGRLKARLTHWFKLGF